ncbi:unnamed protein product [Symbiodinium natans]|uniref:3CxxC-type domain-containing protein n=1 Tax=Symbiodinium natans TaxID=878477 RepID=A0A812UA60_9DINO|nr:unnamed protein product [Symbiodinium natans]
MDEEDFLEAARMGAFDDEGKRSGKGKMSEGKGGGRCPVCKKSLSEDRLSGKHMCKIVATFHCCGKWTSHSGRHNLEEGRVMGQRCKQCGEYGTPSEKFMLADGFSGDGFEKKPHRGDLCEACERYGNCRGVFSNPFEISMAMQLMYDQPAQWRLVTAFPWEILTVVLLPFACFQNYTFQGYLQPDNTYGRRETAVLPAKWQQAPLAPTPPGRLLPMPAEKAAPLEPCVACWLLDTYGPLESSSFLEDRQLFQELQHFGEEMKRNDFLRATQQRAAYVAKKAAVARELRWRHNERHRH